MTPIQDFGAQETPTEGSQALANWQPLLVGEAVVLRPMAAEDWKEMFTAASDPLIWAVHPVRDRYKEPVFRRNFEEALASGSALTILERSTGAIIGMSRYHGFDPERSEIEIGWTFLVRRHWGGATNAEIKRLMLDHAFQWVACVYFRVGETNWRSRGAMTKIGGVLRDGLIEIMVDGAPHPYVVFEIRRD
jgi:RimJ/RimL family protein N-acetyltransferase